MHFAMHSRDEHFSFCLLLKLYVIADTHRFLIFM